MAERKASRQTKLIFPSLKHKCENKIINRNKVEIRILTQLVKGHKNLNTHISNGYER